MTAPDAFAPAQLGPLRLRNRILKAATFEGMTGDQTVSDRLIAFHRAHAAGGVAMTTVAFLPVSPEGAATPIGLSQATGSARSPPNRFDRA